MTASLWLIGCLGVAVHHGPQAGPVALIRTLQTCPRWRERDDAAHALRKFDWKCHPEAALALADALLTDCSEEVREEAAQSLSRMKACLPEVHAALAQAARSNPDRATRRWAARALKGLGKRCEGPCSVCRPALVPEPVAPMAPIPSDPLPVEPDLAPGRSPFAP